MCGRIRGRWNTNKNRVLDVSFRTLVFCAGAKCEIFFRLHEHRQVGEILGIDFLNETVRQVILCSELCGYLID